MKVVDTKVETTEAEHNSVTFSVEYGVGVANGIEDGAVGEDAMDEEL